LMTADTQTIYQNTFSAGNVTNLAHCNVFSCFLLVGPACACTHHLPPLHLLFDANLLSESI
jgi:hypothetical protein